MRTIAIIGCGSSAMILGHALLNHGGYDVTVFSEKTSAQWYDGPPTGTPFVAGENIDIERELGIEHWEDQMFFGDGIMLDYRATRDADPLTVRGRFAKLGAAVDLRTRVRRWMDDFETRGGHLVIEQVSRDRIEAIGRSADLTVLAAGKGELASLVPRDNERSEFDGPQRRLIASLVTGIKGWGLRNAHLTRPIKFTFFGDAGEWFFVPFTHRTTGPCYALNFMVRPDSYLDVFNDTQTCDQFVKIAKSIIAELAPEDIHSVSDCRPVNDQFNYLPFFKGITPQVRQSHRALESGGILLPIGDASITYDPIGGQGYNSAARHAKWVADAIIERRAAPFDSSWAAGVFDEFWEAHGRWACAWNNLMLKGLPPATGMALSYGAENSDFADAIFKDYFRPRAFFSWLTDIDEVQKRISTHTQSRRSES
ncbi:MAG: hypothetical protein ACI915_005103 [Gammaproteobacteria bacterium]|jgi:hypothetical protein